MVSTEVPEPLGKDTGSKAQAAPVGRPLLQSKVTLLPNPLIGDTVIVEAPEPPFTRVSAAGEALSENPRLDPVTTKVRGTLS